MFSPDNRRHYERREQISFGDQIQRVKALTQLYDHCILPKYVPETQIFLSVHRQEWLFLNQKLDLICSKAKILSQ